MTGNPYTTDDLLNLVGIRQRVDAYRFDLVDSVNSKIGEVEPDRTAPPSISLDTSRQIIRSMEGLNLVGSEATALSTPSARIRPVLVLQNGVEFPLGVFLFGDASRGGRSWGSDLSGSLVDQTYILSQPVGRVVTFDVGANCVASALAVCQEVITSPAVVTASTQTLAAPLAWNLRDSRLTIANDLLRLAGYLPVYFDNSGNLTLKPSPLLPLTTADITYEAGGRIVKDSIVESDDLLSAPNRYIVVETGSVAAAAGPIVGVYELPGSAPNSIANRGFAIVNVTEVQGLTDVLSANLAAMAQAATDPHQFRSVQFDSTHDPRHDTFDVVSLLSVLYREVGWKMTLESGARMHHTLRRVYA